VRGVREPLLWIALASLPAFLPFAPLGLPVSIALALSIVLLLRTRLGQHARPALLVALLSAALASLTYAAILAAQMLHGPTFLPHRAAELCVPIALLALATALSRMADVAALESSALWLSAVRLILLGGLAFDLATGGGGFAIQLLACPIFALLVLRMRAEIALPDAR
jgi:hypothetical protein